MIRFFLYALGLLFLFTIQVSFIQALPYPFDRTPLVLVVAIYAYQYRNVQRAWWWLICYGFIVDLFAIAPTALQTLVYALVGGVMILVARHIFTNRSFYGMAATAVVCLVVLTMYELVVMWFLSLTASETFSWKTLLVAQLWAGFFACVLFLFILPPLRHVSGTLQNFILERL